MSQVLQEIKYPGLGLTIHAGLNREPEEIRENIRINCARGLPQIWAHAEQDTALAICAGGPTLTDTLEDLRAVKAQGGKIVSLANTAHFLLAHGIRPDAHVLLDSRPNNVTFLTGIDCQYFVASQCDPSVFEALADKRVLLWHAINNPEEAQLIGEQYDAWMPVQGGNTIALRSLRLFQILGYHRFELFGFDSCNIEGRHHAYPQEAADDMEETVMECSGRRFRVTAWQIQQCMEFMTMTKTFGEGWEIRVHGDGLIAHMISVAGRMENVQT